MNELPTSLLFGVLAFLILVSGFFSSSETGLVSLNRYRLRHMAKSGHGGAKRASELLERPDRLIGIILLGNNFVNILASSISTILAIRLFGDQAITIAAIILTFVILVFAEVAPKTLAVLHPERIAYPATLVLKPLLVVFYPMVWMVNVIVNGLLRLIGVSLEEQSHAHLTSDELRTVVSEAGALIPRKHRMMLTNILDLESVTVNDIMIPRNEIIGIDLEEEWSDIVKQLTNSQHTRMPVYHSDINNTIGLLHIRNVLPVIFDKDAKKDDLMRFIRDAYFVPENTPLNNQLLQFQRHKRRIGLVVDEYGDIKGLVTLEDILEEIVGEFTSEPITSTKDVHPQADGTYLVDGSANIRELNRSMKWHFSTDGPKTINGLIFEHLESIPEPGTSLMISGYPIEIVQIKDNMVKTARIKPKLRKRHTNAEPSA